MSDNWNVTNILPNFHCKYRKIDTELMKMRCILGVENDCTLANCTLKL